MLIVLGILIFAFGFVVFIGAPYLPTLKAQQEAALDLLDLKPGDTFLELGSGDGRVMLAAAKRGLNVVGFEVNPILVVVSLIVTFKYRKQVKVRWGNYWTAKWPECQGIYVFLITRYMDKLDQKITDSGLKKIKVASTAFEIYDKKPAKEKDGVYLYKY